MRLARRRAKSARCLHRDTFSRIEPSALPFHENAENTQPADGSARKPGARLLPCAAHASKCARAQLLPCYFSNRKKRTLACVLLDDRFVLGKMEMKGGEKWQHTEGSAWWSPHAEPQILSPRGRSQATTTRGKATAFWACQVGSEVS